MGVKLLNCFGGFSVSKCKMRVEAEAGTDIAKANDRQSKWT